jgi:cobalt-zinc-cadmium efflux system membrane fusion protein
MKFRHFLLAAVLLGGAIALLLSAGCGSRASAEPQRPPAGEAWLDPAQVQSAGIAVAPASVREVARELLLSGRVAFDDQRVTHVYSAVTGRVTRMIASLGDHVRAGDPLAVIESPDLGAAAADAAKALADVRAAERDAKRMQELLALRAVSERDAEAAEDRFRQATAELERARKKAHLLRASEDGRVSQEYVLRAPIEGEVISRNVNPGAEVQGQYAGGTAVELFTVGATDRVWVLADVYETDLPRLRLGMSAKVSIVSDPGRVFSSRIDWISDAVDPVTRTGRVRCALDNRDHALKPEMYATVALEPPGVTRLAVPRAAVARMGDQTVVFVETGKTANGLVRFERRPVQIEDEGTDGLVPVVRGLAAGERVVTSGTILFVGKA